LGAVPAGSHELRVVAVGFAAVTRTVQLEAGGSAAADFTLSRAVISLDEVVVTATGEQRARESGNSTTNIDLRQVQQTQTTSNLADVLSGRAAGVQVLQAGGTVGTGTRIRIRGQTSLSLPNEPIYYVGGILNDENQYHTNYRSWGHLLPDTFPANKRIVLCTLLNSLKASGAPGSCGIDSLTSYNILMDPTQTPIGTGYRGETGVQVSGGSEQVQYFVSGGYQDELGGYRLPAG